MSSSAPAVPLIAGGKSAADVTREVCGALDAKPSGLWWLGLALSSSALLLGTVAVGYQIATGIGTWGLNTTVGWAFDITNFVFWIGIGHAGTLISAILFLLRQRWRTSVNRAAEAMTLFAVMCAGLFPLIHMGRPWLAFWMLPYPNTRGSLWINFRSPLIWDFFAISTYFTISAIFWYVGLLPDLATIRDRTNDRNGRARARIFGWLSLGWNGSYATWHRYEVVYLLLAALATPLVLSVHTIVSMDFATAVVPGWHTTIFPPYFVAGAIFSGMAMVLTLDAGGPQDDAARGLHHGPARRRDVQSGHPHERDGGPGVRDRVLHRVLFGQSGTSSSRSSTGRSDRWPGATGSWWGATCSCPSCSGSPACAARCWWCSSSRSSSTSACGSNGSSSS